MLQNIRNNVGGPATKAVVWLIVISFSIFGLESILLGGGGGSVAEVNGEQVSPQEMQMALNTQRRQLIAMMGDNIDPSLLEDDRISGQVLNSLIGRKLLTQSAENMDLTVSKREIGSVIGGMEQFRIEGKFSQQLFNSVLSSAGYTPAYFEQTLRDDLVVAQVRSGLAGSEFATPLELALNAQVVAEQRDLRFLTIPLQTFLDKQQATEEQIAAYYSEHQDEFQTAESVVLDYIELSPEQFRKPVDEDAVAEAYRLEIENAQYQTESRVSHILFESDEEAGSAQGLADAQAALASGADFADVAAEFSQDVGSAAVGGDLGFTTGDTFPEEMEAAIAALELNTVSAPVQTDAGTHLIIVTERKEGKPPSLEELRPRLERQIQDAQARTDLLLAVEELKDLVFNAEDLNQPAEEMDLTVRRSDAVTRDQRDGLFSSPALLSAVFSDDVMQGGHNSDVIELADNTFVVLRQHSFSPSQPMELEQVKDEIAAIIVEDAAKVAVAAEADRIVQALASGEAIDQLASEGGYNWQVELAADRRNSAVPVEVLARAFAMPAPAEGEKLVDFILTTSGDAQVISLTQVNPGNLNALQGSDLVSLQQQVTGEYAQLLDAEYQRGLRDRADITVM